ncbi:MAG: vitamin B12-dependent ribonucleotide reductase, partial [Alphaproteobacteria bacterium]|nr:vitamin B12-dependent ribonucleotide reductase [Alphaproteobacteria bacterium]
MRLKRHYTQIGCDSLESVRFRIVSSEERLEYVVPQHWNQAAVGILHDKIFYPESLPMTTKRVEESGVPDWLWRSEAKSSDITEEGRFRPERDIRDVLHRMAGALTYQGWKIGLFASEEEAKIFYDEFRHILLHQIAAPEISQWGMLGLDWAYGLKDVSHFVPRHRIVSFKSGMAKASEG